MASYLMKIFWALLVHLGIGLLAWLLIYLIGSDETALTTVIRTDYADRPEMLDSIRSDAVAQLVQWLVRSLAVSWLLSSIWLVVAQRTRPTGPAEGASRQGLWVVLLLVALAAMAWFGWSLVYASSVSTELASSILTSATAIVALATLLAYYLATGTNVKATMRPSVPLGGILPSFPGTRA